MKVYTKTGDQGETSLYSGQRVSKSDLRVNTYGTVDEVNSFLGMAKALTDFKDIKKILQTIQEDLFVISAELATPNSMMQLPVKIKADDVKRLEDLIDSLATESGLINGFVTPGETLAGSTLDVSRTVVRRMERLLTELAQTDEINSSVLGYVNRLSDLLFIMARVVFWRELKERVTRLVIDEMQKRKMIEKKVKGRPEMTLTLGLAKKIIESAKKEAVKIKVPMVIAIVDSGGNLKSFQRMDDALLASIDIATNKAFTAAALKMPSHKLADLAQPGQDLYGIEATNGGRIVTFGGGYPIYDQGELIGAIGVSGGSVNEDMQVAEAGLKALD